MNRIHRVGLLVLCAAAPACNKHKAASDTAAQAAAESAGAAAQADQSSKEAAQAADEATAAAADTRVQEAEAVAIPPPSQKRQTASTGNAAVGGMGQRPAGTLPGQGTRPGETASTKPSQGTSRQAAAPANPAAGNIGQRPAGTLPGQGTRPGETASTKPSQGTSQQTGPTGNAATGNIGQRPAGTLPGQGTRPGETASVKPSQGTTQPRSSAGQTQREMAQSAERNDHRMTRHIRHAVMDDSSLSFTARNIQIVTHGGNVTLRGLVESEDERETIENIARSHVGAGQVENLLEVEKKPD